MLALMDAPRVRLLSARELPDRGLELITYSDGHGKRRRVLAQAVLDPDEAADLRQRLRVILRQGMLAGRDVDDETVDAIESAGRRWGRRWRMRDTG